MYTRSNADIIRISYIDIFSKFCDTLLSEQRLQMENLWIEYLPRDTIVERGGRAGSPLSHKMFSNLQFTLIVLVFLKMPFHQISSENIVVEERNPPPFPLKILTSNFGQTLNLYCLGHNNMEMDGMGSPNCSVVYIPSSLFNVLHFCTLWASQAVYIYTLYYIM